MENAPALSRQVRAASPLQIDQPRAQEIRRCLRPCGRACRAGTPLPPAGTFVEIKCAGTPAVLTKIEVEDDDDDDDK